MKKILQIAAGILLAGLITLIIRAAYLDYALHAMHLAVEQTAAKQRADAAKLVAENKAKKKAERDRKLATESQKRKQAQENADFDRAWNAYYVTPQDCLVFRSDRHMVECVAAKKQAKKEFLQMYNQTEVLGRQ
jgi:hypothetical protein